MAFPDPLGDFHKRQKETENTISKMLQDSASFERRKDETIGVHALNKKASELIDVTLESTRSSERAATENIALQNKVISLTDELKQLTKWLFRLTIAMAFFALFGLYPTGKMIFQDIHGVIYPAKGENSTDSTKENEGKNTNVNANKN